MEFYYDIKAKKKSDKSYADWEWSLIWSGRITATDKKHARALVEEMYAWT